MSAPRGHRARHTYPRSTRWPLTGAVLLVLLLTGATVGTGGVLLLCGVTGERNVVGGIGSIALGLFCVWCAAIMDLATYDTRHRRENMP